MNSKFKSAAHAIGARLRHFFLFFLGGEVLEFECASSPEALRARLRSSRHGPLNLATGFQVRAWGDRVHVGWPPGFMRRSTLAFRGIIESTPTGSRIRGRISLNLFNRLILGLSLGIVMLISLTAISTVFIPVVGLTLIWFGWELIGTNEFEPKMIRYLSLICADSARPPSPE